MQSVESFATYIQEHYADARRLTPPPEVGIHDAIKQNESELETMKSQFHFHCMPQFQICIITLTETPIARFDPSSICLHAFSPSIHGFHLFCRVCTGE